MSVISPLEIIELFERAQSVYERCRSARADYRELGDHVQILKHAISEVKQFVETEGVPPDVAKIKSLQSARDSCIAVLGEVDEFLTKYARVDTADKRRAIAIMRFIAQDLDGLKAKLSHCTTFLQLGLTSLNTLSMSKVQKTLDTILQEYRSGKREPSVLSQAVGNNRAVERQELMQQLRTDLEDKNIHPDAFELNSGPISSWLTRVVNNGGFEEESDDAPPPLSQFHRKSSYQDDAPPPPLSSFHRKSSYQDTSPTLEFGTLDRHDSGSFHASAKSPESEVDFTLPEVDEMESRSRPGSASSHRSQPDDWHPQNKPDPDYVYAMLDGYFKNDYTKPPSLDETRLRIVRAFNQQDWSHRGTLTRPEVYQLSSQVLQRAGVRHQGEIIRKKVAKADKDRDGQLNKQEFVELMDELIQLSAEIRGQTINEQLNSLSKSLQQNEEDRRDLTSTEEILPWKWAKIVDSGTTHYVDEVTDTTTSTAPSVATTRDLFTIIAREGDICVEKISDFKQHWLGIVPQSLQSEFLEALDAIHAAAIKFTTFEMGIDENQFSDFDALVSCYKIVVKTGRDTEIPEANDLMAQLEEARKRSLVLLSLVQGICWRLLSFSTAEFEPNAQSFPQFQKMWVSVKIGDFARQITRRFSDKQDGWAPIQRTIDGCLKTNLLERLELVAIEAAKLYIGVKQDELTRLKATVWRGTILSVKVHLQNVSRVLMGLVDDKRRFIVHVNVDNPPQKFVSTYEKASQAITWSFLKQISLEEFSCIEVSVYEQRGQTDVLFHKFSSVAPEEYGQRDRGFDFSQRQPNEVKLRCSSDEFSWSMNVKMEDQTATAREISQLERCSWMDLLDEKETPDPEIMTTQVINRRKLSSRMSLISRTSSQNVTPQTVPKSSSPSTTTPNGDSPEIKPKPWEATRAKEATKAISSGTTKFMSSFKGLKRPTFST